MQEPKYHEHLNKALSLLDSLNFQGYKAITEYAPKIGLAMTELILLEQEVVKYKQDLEAASKEKEKDDEQET